MAYQRHFFIALSLLLALTSCTFRYSRNAKVKAPKNIIYVIADGMGPKYIDAARIFNGNEPLVFESFPYHGKATTCPKEGTLPGQKTCDPKSREITDSAASATAIATGEKVSNGVLSIHLPGNQTPIKTMLEVMKDRGKSTGIVSTKLITDATPAAFAAHTSSRENENDILLDYFSNTHPNVVFGADKPSYRVAAEQSKVGYTLATTKSKLDTIASKAKSCRGESCPHVYGGFGQHALIPGSFERHTGLPFEVTGDAYYKEKDIPHLSDMARSAIQILDRNKNGFFLMVESALTDYVGHTNRMLDKKGSGRPSSIKTLAHEMMELDKTMAVIMEYVKDRNDTLIVVTADHETGGLALFPKKTKCWGQKGCLVTHKWTTGVYPGSEFAKHSGTDVSVFALGPNAERFAGNINNTDFYAKTVLN